MGNDLAVVKELKIKESFRTVIPPLAPEEYQLLEQSIIADGCRDAILTWGGFIIDGHNRYEICQKRGIPFITEERDFHTEQDAMVWIINNQLGRRNVTDYQKGELVLKKKDILLLKGKKQQGRRTDILSIVDKKLEPHSTREEMAKDIGVSLGTMARIEIIAKEAPEQIKEDLRRGKVKIGSAYKKLKGGAAPEPKDNKTLPEPSALAYAEMAIAHLEKMGKDDETVNQAFDTVLEWMIKNNHSWALGAARNIRRIVKEHVRTGSTKEQRTPGKIINQEPHGLLKENLRGVQESLWGET